jgi:hypothetical protein
MTIPNQSSKRIAPFVDTEIASLNSYQNSNYFHPYTCGKCNSVLVAFNSGWHCLSDKCGYRQDWAHVWTLDWTWNQIKSDLERMERSL